MNTASAKELLFHYAMMENGNDGFQKLFETYNAHLLSCLFRWYKKELYADSTLANEAVYTALTYYCSHPRAFDPRQGSLKKFLEILASKYMQMILDRENHPVSKPELKHVLTRFFDNNLDINLAKLMIREEKELSNYISLLDIGNCRIDQQLAEIKRHCDRVGKTLDIIKKSYAYLFGRNQKIHSSPTVNHH